MTRLHTQAPSETFLSGIVKFKQESFREMLATDPKMSCDPKRMARPTHSFHS